MPPTENFFTTLFYQYPHDEDLRLEIRCLAPRWDADRQEARPRQWFALERQYLENAARFCDRHKATWDVYFGVLPRRERTGRQEDVGFASCLFADVDGGADGIEGAVERIDSADIPRPHIGVRSGHGVHCYWLLSEIVELPDHNARERFKAVLRRLCRAIGGAAPYAHADTTACEAARVLRVPNTINHKIRTEPRPVEIVHCTVLKDARLTYNDWRELLPAEPIESWLEKKNYAPSYSPAGFINDGLMRWAKTPYSIGERYRGLVGAAAWLVRDCGLTQNDALALLSLKMTASGQGASMTPEKLEKMVKWATL